MNATSNVATTNTNKNGMIATMNSSIFVPVIEHVVNIIVPNGGVSVPILILIMKNIPKCTGSIPYCCSIGINKGVRIIIDTFPSTNIPIIKRKIKTIIKNNIGEDM